MSETKHVITLSDYNYLVYGLTLFESIDQYSDDYIIHYLCTDKKCFDTLSNLQLPNIACYNIADLENNTDFISLRENNISNKKSVYSVTEELHWSLASFFSYHLLEKHKLPHVLYIDSDILFYNTIDKIFEAMGDKSIGVITHKHNKKDAETGYFNVGIVYFKNDDAGNSCLKFWRDCCIDPHNKYAEKYGTCGDQKYLELFGKLFGDDNVEILCPKVGNLAPWNLPMCTLTGNDKFIWHDKDGLVLEAGTSLEQDLLFMHFSHFSPDFKSKSFSFDRKGEWGPIHTLAGVQELYTNYFIKCISVKERYGL
tara:strand:- start:94 stop:1026 length:933 start_codon:yes stop_codon:yes gene_type:complete